MDPHAAQLPVRPISDVPNLISLAEMKKYRRAAAIAAFFFIPLLANCADQETPKPAEKLSVNPAVKPAQSTSEQASNTDPVETINAEEQAFNVILSSEFAEANTIEQNTFDCDQKIYAVLHFHHFPKKLYQIEVNWIDPYDKKRETTKIPFYVSGLDNYSWSSLALHRSVGAGMLQWINPAAGMEEFIGKWSLEVMLDGKTNQRIEFEVVC